MSNILKFSFYDSNKFVPDTVSHMNFFKRYLFKKALLEDELANEERSRKEATVIEKQPEPAVVETPKEIPTASPLKNTKDATASGGKKFIILKNFV